VRSWSTPPPPAAYDDAFVVLKAVIAACRTDGAEAEAEPLLAAHGDASRIVLAGDSTGGNMVHNVAIRLRKEGGIEGYGDMVSGIVLLHPYFWGKEPLGAEPMDPGYRAMFYPTWEFICGGKFGLDHPYVNPMASPEEWRQLGSRCVLVTTAEQCWFVERARAYAERIKKCGWDGELEFYETKGEAHVFFLPKHGSDNTVKELAIVAEFVRRC
jgi:acetyl esterase/lipase